MSSPHPSLQARVECHDLTFFNKMNDQLWLKGPCLLFEEVIYCSLFFFFFNFLLLSCLKYIVTTKNSSDTLVYILFYSILSSMVLSCILWLNKMNSINNWCGTTPKFFSVSHFCTQCQVIASNGSYSMYVHIYLTTYAVWQIKILVVVWFV